MSKSAEGEKGPVSEKKSPAARATTKDKLESSTRVWISVIDGAFKTVRHALTCGVIGVCAWMAYRAVEAMAGKATDFRSAIDWAVKMSMSEVLAWALAVVLGAGCYNRHRAFKKLARQAGPRLKALEEAFDSERTTSGMQPTGDPPAGEE